MKKYILCLILFIILLIFYFLNYRENYDLYNFNQPYYIKDNKYGYFLLIDKNYNVNWNKSFSNKGGILFRDPLVNSEYIEIKNKINNSDTVNNIYIEGNKLLLNHNLKKPKLLFDVVNNIITSFIGNNIYYLIINKDGSFNLTVDRSKASHLTLITDNNY